MNETVDKLTQISELLAELKQEYEVNPTIDGLAALRKVMVLSQDANNASEGFCNLLSQLYPDNAHYIYELLQNARDANKDEIDSKVRHTPSVVQFILTSKTVEFEHSGWKLFTVKDIESITGLGVSTKIDDPTNVGKFGVGFKSVFAMTDTPEIVSGEHHFTIERLFIPNILYPVSVNNTRFIFPFNNPSKKPEQAVKEIEKELRGLGSETLLFLNEIGKIEYLLPDGGILGYMKREEPEKHNGVTIINVDIPNEGKNQFHWLCFDKDVPIVDENGKSVICPIAVAFKLKADVRKEHQGEWTVVAPDNGGKVCIYFPANKEKSNLKFHIHASFASTVARESIRDIESNNLLIDAIAQLTADAIIEIKDKHQNLLNVDFLGILPNYDDDLTGSSNTDDGNESVSYEPIRNAIISIFKNEPLVPTKNGSFAPAHRLYRDVSENIRISAIIDDSDLALLTKQSGALWATTNRNNARANKFLDSLEIEELGSDELSDIFTPDNDLDRTLIEDWISKKSDDLLMRLYALLADEEINVDPGLKIVRTTKGTHVRASEAYFPPENGDDMPNGLNFVKPEAFNIGDTEKRKRAARTFLDILGVQPYNERNKVKERLKRYQKNENLSPDRKYFDDIRYFVDYLEKHPNGKKDFANEAFLIGECNDKAEWVTSAQLRIVPSELADEIIELGLNQHRVWTGYNSDSLGAATYTAWYKFLTNIGVIPYTERELIEIRAEKYIRRCSIKVVDVLADTQRFLDYAKSDSDGIEAILRDAYFVIANNNHIYRPFDVCTGLMSDYYHLHSIPTLSDKYGEIYKQVEDFIVNLGAIQTLKIKEVSANNWNSWLDHRIENLDKFLELVKTENDINAARLLWGSICACDDNYAAYVHTPGRRDTHGASTLVTKLKSAAWIPQIVRNVETGEEIFKFVLPADAHEDLLPDDFVLPDTNTGYSWSLDPPTEIFNKIGFGKNAHQQQYIETQEQQREEKALEVLGITKGEAEFAKEMRNLGVTHEVLRSLVDEKHRKAAFPTSSTRDPERRAQKAAEDYQMATPINYETRERSVRVSCGSVDAKPYLYNLYINDDEELFCQICEKVMPFKYKGSYYFEAVESLNDVVLSRESEEKYFALCPTCAAKYKLFVKQDNKQMESFYDAILAYDSAKEPIRIPLNLGDEQTTIRFVQKHFIDLKSIVESKE